MRNILIFLLTITLLFLTSPSFTWATSSAFITEEVLQKINLPVPNNIEEKNYLRISGSGNFKIPQIKAQLIFIEIFSMYCPYCQADAQKINELYQLIEKDLNLKNKIKMIGIGAGNTPFEVGVFKKTYKVLFPLFSDKDFVIHRILGEPRTPYFIIIKVNEDKTFQIVHTQLGGFPGAEKFLELMINVSGIK